MLTKSSIKTTYVPKNLSTGSQQYIFIKAKPLEMCSPCPLMHKVAASFYGEIEIIIVSLRVAHLIITYQLYI